MPGEIISQKFKIRRHLLEYGIKNRLRSVRNGLIRKGYIKSTSRTSGFCNNCGRETVFFYKAGETFNNSYICTYCGANARYRLIALILSNLILERKTLANQMLSLKDIPGDHKISILDTSYKSCLYPLLKRKSHYRMSEYYPEIPFGTRIMRMENQSFTDLKVRDKELDFIISSEVFEHVDNPWEGFNEVRRVLKPGGFHIFTIPFHEDSDISVTRARVDENGKIRNLMPEAFHINPLSKNGSLVFTDFGKDLIPKLNQMGLETEFVKYTNEDLVFRDTYLLVSKKV